MTVRLGFAIAAHLEPEILVVDEVLAVGDAEFQKKAIGKMQDVSKGEGRTVLFVRHNMGAVRNLCKSGIVLDKGRVAFSGGVNEAVDYYTSTFAVSQKTKIELNRNTNTSAKDAFFKSISFAKNKTQYASNEDIDLNFCVEANRDIPNCRINFTIVNLEGISIGSLSNENTFSLKKHDEQNVQLSIKDHHLSAGVYEISFSLGIGNYKTCQTDFDYCIKQLSFEVTKPDLQSDDGFGQWNRSWGNIMFKACTRVI